MKGSFRRERRRGAREEGGKETPASRRNGENNGFLAGVPLLPPPSRVVSRPNCPFRTPATQARFIWKSYLRDLDNNVIK